MSERSAYDLIDEDTTQLGEDKKKTMVNLIADIKLQIIDHTMNKTACMPCTYSHSTIYFYIFLVGKATVPTANPEGPIFISMKVKHHR